MKPRSGIQTHNLLTFLVNALYHYALLLGNNLSVLNAYHRDLSGSCAVVVVILEVKR